MRHKPIVGLNCSYKPNRKYAAHESFVFEQYYDSVASAGGLPVLLPPLADDASLDALLRLCRGLVLIGGDDMDPSRYGQKPHEKTEVMQPRRDEFDFRLARAAVRLGVPTLAICGGCQLLNVAQGGTLHQHVPDVYGEGVLHAPTDEMRKEGRERMHGVHIEKGTLLHSVVGRDELEVNSSHHQSVDRPADGLRVSARSPDGVIEALEWTDQPGRPFVLAVQWHPERISSVREHMLLFEALVNTAQSDRPSGAASNPHFSPRKCRERPLGRSGTDSLAGSG